MKGIKLLSILMSALLFSAAAYGEETETFSDIAELSYVDTGGNTNVNSILLNNTLMYHYTESILATWNLSLLSNETDGEKKAEKYSTSLRADYRLTSSLYTFGDLLWLKDKFTGIDGRRRYSAGMGYKILRGPKHKLATEAGLNYTTEEYTDNTDRNYIGGRLYARYAYHFTKKNYVGQWVEYLPDFDDSENYLVNAETSLVSALNSFLSIKTAYLVEHDAEPLPGNKKTDTKLAVTLLVNFQ